MTPLAALGFAFFGSIIGFLAGMFVTLAHPIYLKAREGLLEARESRKKTAKALNDLTDLIGERARIEYQQQKEQPK